MSPFGDMKPDEMDAVFAALAAESRRRILDILKKEPGCNVTRVRELFDDIGPGALMQHLHVLEGANLVRSEKVGRERLLYFNPVPIHMIYDRWTTEYSAYWAGRLPRMKPRRENAPIQINRKKGGSRG